MNRHLSFRSGNPALNSKVFQGFSGVSGGQMTLNGTVNKVGISLFILIVSACYTFMYDITSFIWVGFIGGFIAALITIFKKEWAPYTVPVYAALEGLALGGISAIYEHIYTGIAQQAVFLTFGVFFALLFAYKSRIIKPTENFKLGIFAATAGIGIVYLIAIIYGWFSGGSTFSFMEVGGPDKPAPLISIGFSLVVVVIAALNLVLDFDFIEEASEKGLPKYMEWYGAFGLLVTLVWLYLEILRLLAKLNSRR
tara:strand:- start:66 stop:824 length:759 start_codon:yes stop_codon:yes gene_type:complete